MKISMQIPHFSAHGSTCTAVGTAASAGCLIQKWMPILIRAMKP
jgi:hypothetical protein